MKTAIFWDIALCSPYMNRRFEGTYHLHLQGRKSAKQQTSMKAGGQNMVLYPRRWQFSNVNLWAQLIRQHAMKTYGGVTV
jgi:hypothetical protein